MAVLCVLIFWHFVVLWDDSDVSVEDILFNTVRASLPIPFPRLWLATFLEIRVHTRTTTLPWYLLRQLEPKSFNIKDGDSVLLRDLAVKLQQCTASEPRMLLTEIFCFIDLRLSETILSITMSLSVQWIDARWWQTLRFAIAYTRVSLFSVTTGPIRARNLYSGTSNKIV